jgi:hypothetical protein
MKYKIGDILVSKEGSIFKVHSILERQKQIVGPNGEYTGRYSEIENEFAYLTSSTARESCKSYIENEILGKLGIEK